MALVDPEDGSALYWGHAIEGLFIVRVLGPNSFVFEGLNPAHERATGLSSSLISGCSPQEVLPKETADKVLHQYRRCVRLGQSMSYRETLDLPGGRKHWLTNLVPVRNDGGRIVRLIGSARDITEQVDSLQAALKARDTLEHTLEALSAGIVLLDETGLVLSANQAWRSFAEQAGASSDGIGSNYIDVCAGAALRGDLDAAFVQEQLAAVVRGSAEEFHHQYRCDDRYFQMHCISFETLGERRILVAHEDTTDAVQAQLSLAERSQQLLHVQEEDRRRIAQELHDSTSQHLFVIQLGISAIMRGDQTEDLLAQMQQSLKQAQKEIRSISYLLHPPRLYGNGFRDALRSFVGGFRKRTSIEVKVRLRGPINKMPVELQQTVYRIVQEALANVARHSNANLVQLSLVAGKSGLHLIVRDNGTEPSGHKTEFAPGVGLMGMEARVREFDGKLSVVRAPKGVAITADFPLKL